MTSSLARVLAGAIAAALLFQGCAATDYRATAADDYPAAAPGEPGPPPSGGGAIQVE